jgi:hypothetical protein
MNSIVQKAGEHILLPDEEPALLTVTDKSKIQGQNVLKKAENGDKALVYSKAGLIVVYRPSVDKLVAVGPLLGGKSGSAQLTSTFALMNGADSQDTADGVTRGLFAAFPNARIADKPAAPRTFPTTIIIDISGKQEGLAQQIADTLGIQKGILPTGVTAPSADFLIIVGQDKN